jgi:hypothetical protein
MKRLFAILLVVTMLLALVACGSSEPDPNAGIYYGTVGTYSGFSMPVEKLFEGGCSLELKNGGKGVITLGADPYNVKWSLEGETITVTLQGEDSIGTLKDGVIDIEFLGLGLNLTFEK